MKTRMGFVSNSSSSSFIIGFKEIPDTVEKMQELLFGDCKRPIQAYDGVASASVGAIASQVLRDISGEEPITKEEFIDRLASGWPLDTWLERPECPDMRGLSRKDIDMAFNAYDEKLTEFAEKLYELFCEKYKDMSVFIVDYADSDGDFHCTMEHGDVFSNIPHIRVSTH